MLQDAVDAFAVKVRTIHFNVKGSSMCTIQLTHP